MPARRRGPGAHRREITGAQRDDLWLGASCRRDHRLFGGVWCPCSPFETPALREEAFWSLPEEERRTYAAQADYDERFRAAAEEAERTDRDVVLVEIERGLLAPYELASLLSIGSVLEDPVILERAEAARKALEAGRPAT